MNTFVYVQEVGVGAWSAWCWALWATCVYCLTQACAVKLHACSLWSGSVCLSVTDLSLGCVWSILSSGEHSGFESYLQTAFFASPLPHVISHKAVAAYRRWGKHRKSRLEWVLYFSPSKMTAEWQEYWARLWFVLFRLVMEEIFPFGAFSLWERLWNWWCTLISWDYRNVLKQSLVIGFFPSWYSKLHVILTEEHKYSPLTCNFIICLSSIVFEGLLLERLHKFVILRLEHLFIRLLNILSVKHYVRTHERKNLLLLC